MYTLRRRLAPSPRALDNSSSNSLLSFLSSLWKTNFQRDILPSSSVLTSCPTCIRSYYSGISCSLEDSRINLSYRRLPYHCQGRLSTFRPRLACDCRTLVSCDFDYGVTVAVPPGKCLLPRPVEALYSAQRPRGYHCRCRSMRAPAYHASPRLFAIRYSAIAL